MDRIIVRTSTVYGEGDNNPSLLKYLISKIVRGETVETHVYENGSPLVDLLHVRDMARALKEIAELDGIRVIHLASEEPVTTLQLAELLITLAQSKSNIELIKILGRFSPALLDASYARTVLGWSPQVTLEEGLRLLIESHKLAGGGTQSET